MAQGAFKEYLGSVDAGKEYDACHLVKKYQGPKLPILIDQGTADNFMDQLNPDAFKDACGQAGYPVTVRMQPGYDHGYYFIQTFVKDHIEFHASNLKLTPRK